MGSDNRLNGAARKRQHGVAAVEMAILLPIFIVLLAVPLYLGRIYWHYSAATKAAHDAARYLSSVSLLEMRTPSKVGSAVAIANDIVQAETADLNPGPYPAVVTVLCDGHTCDGFSTPIHVNVVVRLYMVDTFFTGITTFLWHEEGMALTANVTFPYTGK